jgi:hypothetical protein
VRLWLLVLYAACGRSGFEPCGTSDATSDGTHDVAADAVTNLEQGLVLHLAFEPGAYLTDTSPAVRGDALCTNSLCPVQIGGRVGAGAAAFSGTQCLSIVDALDLRPNAFTFAIWIAPQATVAGGTPFARPYMGASAVTDTFAIEIDPSPLLWNIYVGGQGIAANVTMAWHHVVGVYDGNVLTVYIDGVTPKPPVNAGAAIYFMDDVRVGCDFEQGSEQYKYKGSLDDVRFYNRPLTAAEVAELAAM